MEPLSKQTARRRVRRAFTIIELLVAIGITAVMLTLMINISINMLKVWNQAGGRLSSGNQARIALDYLSQDLQAAIIKRDGNIWLAATVQRNPPGANGDEDIDNIFDSAWTLAGGNIKPDAGAAGTGNSLDLAATLPTDAADDGKIENVRFGKAGVWLRFFTSPPDSNAGTTTLSAPRAVSYMISRGRVGSASAQQYMYALFRSQVRPDATFSSGYNITSADYDQYNAATPLTSIIRRPAIDELIANNVIDFGVRLYERNSAGAFIEVFPARRNSAGAVTSVSSTAPVTYLATSASSPVYTSYGNTAGSVLAPGIPVVAEVMVRILTPEGVRLLQAFEEAKTTRPPGAGSNDEYWWQLASEHSQVYTRRIEIRSVAL